MTRPSGARWSSPARRSAIQARSVASNTAPSRLDAVSSGPKTRKSCSRRCARMTSRRNPPSTRVASLDVVAGRAARRRRSRGSRAARGRAAAGRRWRAGWRSCAARPSGASAGELGRERAVVVEQLLGPVGAHPGLELREVLGVGRAARRAAPGGRATCPRPAGRRPPWARSSPSACAARSSASAAARRPPSRARALDRGDLVERLVERARPAPGAPRRARRPRRTSGA